jgi:hypothetical protein
VSDELEDRNIINPADESGSPHDAPTRALVIWFSKEGPERAEWRETDGWTIYGIPAADDVVRAPLGLIPTPQDTAEWITDVLAGRPRPGQPAETRRATDRDELTESDLDFENRLAAYLYDGEFTPRLVPPPEQPRPGMAWSAPLRHRCLTCPRSDGRQPWTRRESAS